MLCQVVADSEDASDEQDVVDGGSAAQTVRHRRGVVRPQHNATAAMQEGQQAREVVIGRRIKEIVSFPNIKFCG